MKKELVSVITVIILLPGIWLIFKNSLGWQYLAVLLLIVVIVQGLISGMVTNKKKTSAKKTPKRQASKSPRKTNNTHNTMDYNDLLVADLDKMNGFDFENLCYYYLNSIYKECEKTPDTKDRGVDIIFKDREGFRVAVQVKHKTESGKQITGHEINALEGAKRNYKCTRTMFITTTGYTKDAINVATDRNMRIEDITWVENKILRWRDKEAQKRKIV